MKCEICNKEIDNSKGLSVHLVKSHNFNNNDKKEYYNKYFKKENEGRCYFCNNEAKFFDLTRGYHKICNSKECLGKTRATGTYEFLMYKYGLSKKEAIILMNKRKLERGEKITNGLQKSFEKNQNFFKEKSHQTIEFWLKKGYSQKKAEIEVKKVLDEIHEKTWSKRRNNPELYKNINTTQIEYWLKKGFTEEESKEKIKERQRTFTLEKCIEKHGEIEGLKIWNSRQLNWSKNMINTMLKNGNYKKDFSKPEKELVEKLINILNLKNEEYYSCLNEQYFVYDKDTKKIYTYDFVLKNNKKVIEFNGDYWHCNPIKYKGGFFNKRKQMFAKDIWIYDEKRINKIKEKGYDVLTIWESEYKQNKDETIQKCIDFLSS